MKIAFLVPPALPNGQFIAAEDCCGSTCSSRLMPAGILSMANEARLAGHTVRYWDASIDTPNLAGFDVAVWPLLWHYHEKTMKAMWPIIEDVPIKIVWAIPHGYASHYAELYQWLNFVIYSEPEMVVASLPLDRKNLDLAWLSLMQGIKWMEGGTLINGEGYFTTCLDRLAPIAFDSLVPDHYWQHCTQMAYQVTRGCPYRCTFCMWGGSTVTDKTFKIRRPEVVADDIHQIRFLSNGKITLYLLAAQLTTDIKWLRHFCSLMEDEPMPYRSNVNLVELTDEKIDLLIGSGMVQAVAGLEALTDRTLKMINKAHTFDEAVRGIKVLEQSGISYRLHLRCGYGETDEDVKESLANLYKLAKIMKHGQVDLGPLIYYKGTEIARQPKSFAVCDHPSYDVSCPTMRDLPAGWANFASEAARLGLMHKRGLKGLDSDWVCQYEACVNKWRGPIAGRRRKPR